MDWQRREIVGYKNELEEDSTVCYLAGHWRSRLWQSLLWVVTEARKPAAADFFRPIAAPEPYLVPSWSRLARGGTAYLDPEELEPGHGLFRAAFELLSVSVALAGPNPFGAITRGEIVLHGTVFTPREHPDFRAYGPRPKGYSGFGLLDEYRLDLLVGLDEDGDEEEGQFCRFTLDYDCPARELAERAAGLSMVCLGSRKDLAPENFYMRDLRVHVVAYGLMLSPAERANHFHRVGMFWFKGENADTWGLFWAGCRF